MAKKDSSSLISELKKQYQKDYDAQSEVRETWDEKEALLLGDLLDSGSKEKKATKVNSPELQTGVLKRTNNVVAQLPTGKVQALSKDDRGKNLMMNYVLTNYVIPNANTQNDIYTKSWMLELYSLIYGTENVLVDYMVSDKYIGPDFYLLNQRDFIPQKNKISIEDSERCFVRSYVSRKWLLDRDTKNWKNIDKLLEKKPDRKDTSDVDKSSYVERQASSANNTSDGDEYELLTRYEGDRWVTFASNYDIILRDIDNPHQNNELPIVSKHAFPLKDRFYGLGEFERGLTLQYSLNSLINLYLAGVKMSIFPPLKIYLPDVIARTIENEPGAKWILKNMNPNAVSEHVRSPQGIQTFQSTYGFLKGALLTTLGTTDTTISQTVDVGMGKTPQALKMQAAMDQSRSTFDRVMLERAMGKIYEKFIDLIATKQEKPIKMYLGERDIQAIKEVNPDVVEMFESGKYGEVIIKPSHIKNTKYKYFIDAGSTLKKDEAIEHESLSETIEDVLKIPGADEQIARTGKVILGSYTFNYAEALKRKVITSGVQDWEKIVSETKPQDIEELNADLQGMGRQDPTAGVNGKQSIPQQEVSNGMYQMGGNEQGDDAQNNQLSQDAEDMLASLRQI